MKIERLKKIIAYSHLHKEETEAKVKHFYSCAGMNSEQEVRNIVQIIKSSFLKKGYFVLEIPFADEEIGALSYKGDALSYIVLNTSLPEVNRNFALCHEIYHVFYQESGLRSKVEFSRDCHGEDEEEFAANLFAGTLLMPETGFRFMYSKFKGESDGSEWDICLRLMSYYQVPYMAALVRCCELGLPASGTVSEKLLHADRDAVRSGLARRWLDVSILDATKRDDYAHLEEMVAQIGREYVRDSYINERTLRKVLQNMRSLYSDIKGE